MRASFVKIQRRQVGNRTFDSINVSICDLRLSCDLMEDRQIKLARRLADEHGAWFMYDEDNAQRVRAVLGVRADAKPEINEESDLVRYKETLEAIARCGEPSGDAHIAARSALRWDEA